MYFGGPMATLDIILPAYNPLPGWEEVVINRFKSLGNQLPEVQLQLIIVNDGSSKINENVSVKRIEKDIQGFQWLSYPQNKGKGYALRKGVEMSSSEFIVYTDIDWPYTQASMLGLINELMKESEAVIGIRDEAYYNQLPLARRRISRLLKKINAKLLRLKVADTQAGLKGFRKNVKNIFLSTTINRYLFDLEFVYLLSGKKELNVTGFPIALRPDITFSKMNRNILFQEARNFLKIWLRG